MYNRKNAKIYTDIETPLHLCNEIHIFRGATEIPTEIPMEIPVGIPIDIARCYCSKAIAIYQDFWPEGCAEKTIHILLPPFGLGVSFYILGIPPPEEERGNLLLGAHKN